MLKGFKGIAINGFSEDACKLIAIELNKKLPESAFELMGILADMGTTALVTIDKDILIVTNVNSLIDEEPEVVNDNQTRL